MVNLPIDQVLKIKNDTMCKVLQAGYVVYTAKQNKNNLKNRIKSTKVLKATSKLLWYPDSQTLCQIWKTFQDQPQAKYFNIWHLP